MAITRRKNMLFLSDGIGINRCIVKGERVNYPLHFHKFVEFVYMEKGHCVHVIDGKEYPSKAGDMLIINYGQSHEIQGNTDVEYVNFYIKPEYINQAISERENAFALLNLNEFEDFKKIIHTERSHISFQQTERQRIEQLLRFFEEDTKGNDGGRGLALRSEINLLLITVFRKLSVPFCEKFDGINDKLLSFIEENYDEKLTLEEMAKKCSYNKSYFSRLFKEYVGFSFTVYLRNLRIKKAAAMIKNTDRLIEEIITECGYTDKTKFFKHFKACYGVTPLGYRKK